MTVPAKEKEEIKDGVAEQTADLEENYAELDPVQFSAQYAAQQGEIPLTEPQPADPVQDLTEQEFAQQEEMTRRDREILAALDEVLQKNSAQNREANAPKRSRTDIRKLVVCTVKNGAGVLSLALTMIFMGIVLVCVTLSSQPDYLLIAKLSPIAAVLLGIELMLSWFLNRKRLRINIPCVGIIAVIVAGCCTLSGALDRSEAVAVQEQNARVVEAEIYEASYKRLRHSADILELTIKADLLPASKQKSMETLAVGDTVEISAVLDGNYSSPREFAAECSAVIGVYKDLDIPVTNYHFSSETRLSSFALDVEGLFQQDMTEEELTSLVRHIYVEDYDYIQDLEDFQEETAESAESMKTTE